MLRKGLIYPDWRLAVQVVKLIPNLPLANILDDALSFTWVKFGFGLVVTSVWRPAASSGIHSLYRAIDLQTELLTDFYMNEIRAYINGNWDYGKEGYEVIPDIRHGTAPHIHMQVRPNGETKYRVST